MYNLYSNNPHKNATLKQEKKMSSRTQTPHVVCIPVPAQSHTKAMLKLAKLLHSQGVHITFINVEYNHKRLEKSGGPDSVAGLPNFRFLTIPDGITPTDVEENLDIARICLSMAEIFVEPVVELVEKLNAGEFSEPNPPVSYILADGFTTTFSIDVANRVGIPIMLYWTIPACAFMGLYQVPVLMEKGVISTRDERNPLYDYNLESMLEIPGMKHMRVKDLPVFTQIQDFCVKSVQHSNNACGNIFHTFEELEADEVASLSSMIPQVFTIGPMELLMDKVLVNEDLKSIRYSLWKEDDKCLEWLDSKEVSSVIYVNFGSIAVLSAEKMLEIGWGLVNSKKYFLWVVRQTPVESKGSSGLPDKLLEACKEKGFITSWCPQEEVLGHTSVGAFLTHCGWNSTIESLSAGVPMICLPSFGDQMTICRYICVEWEVGIELDRDLKRNDVEKVVKDIMEGDCGKEMKQKAVKWSKIAGKATSKNGSSLLNFDKLVNKFS